MDEQAQQQRRLQRAAETMMRYSRLPSFLADMVAEQSFRTGIRYCLVTAPYVFDCDVPVLVAKLGLADTLAIPISLN